MKSLNHLSRRSVSLMCAIALVATSLAQAFAQQPANAKRPITHKDYDAWHSIQSPQISRDGKFVAYAYMAQDEDSEIVARNLATGQEWRAARGYRPPAPPPDDSIPNFGELIAAQARLARPTITADSRFVVFSMEPAKAELNKAKKDKKKPEDMPKNGLGIMDLSNGQVAKIDRVKNFQVPEDAGGFIAYLMESKPAANREATPPKENPATSPNEGQMQDADDTIQNPPGARPGARGPKKEFGTDLIIRNTATGTERTINDVLDYSLSKDAKSLAYTVASKNEDTNGVYVIDPQSDAAPVILISGKGKYQKLTWDEDQKELAFISDRDDQNSKQPKFKVYLWERGSATPVAGRGETSRESANNHATTLPAPIATEVVSNNSPGFRKDFVVSDKANLSFSLDGSRLFLGASLPPEPEKSADDDIPADEKVLVDLWHWKDDYIQPMQKVRAEQERSRSYRAAYDVKGKKFLQLADEKLETLVPSNDGRLAVGADNRAYRITNDYDPGMTDYYVVNADDGSRKLITQKQRFNVSLSPGGKYAIYFDGRDWNSYAVGTGAKVNLTKSLGVNFFNEDNDTPEAPNAYGVAGWTKDDSSVLITIASMFGKSRQMAVAPRT